MSAEVLTAANSYTTHLTFRIKASAVRMNSHGVVEVADDAGRLARCRVSEAGVVGVAENSLKPGQRAGRRHRLVGEMTCRQKNKTGSGECLSSSVQNYQSKSINKLSKGNICRLHHFNKYSFQWAANPLLGIMGLVVLLTEKPQLFIINHYQSLCELFY